MAEMSGHLVFGQRAAGTFSEAHRRLITGIDISNKRIATGGDAVALPISVASTFSRCRSTCAREDPSWTGIRTALNELMRAPTLPERSRRACDLRSMIMFARQAAIAPQFDFSGELKPSRADALRRMELVARLLDTAFVIPGTKQRFGIDAVVGLVPGLGDIVTTVLSSYVIWEARNLGVSRFALGRMMTNLAIHAAIGSLPVVGDLFDAFFRVNQRNMRIVRSHLRKAGALPR